jgi:hypothetical protein
MSVQGAGFVKKDPMSAWISLAMDNHSVVGWQEWRDTIGGCENVCLIVNCWCQETFLLVELGV